MAWFLQSEWCLFLFLTSVATAILLLSQTLSVSYVVLLFCAIFAGTGEAVHCWKDSLSPLILPSQGKQDLENVESELSTMMTLTSWRGIWW